MNARPAALHGVPGNERINAFTDGVFAIAITLLVLELKIPEHIPESGLAAVLPEMMPRFAGHIISFLVLGAYWVGHNNMFMHIRRHDRMFTWLNLLFLMFIGIMPFGAGLIVNHSNDQWALITYGANAVLAGLAIDACWWYASSGRRLVEAGFDPALVTFIHRRALASPVLYTVAIGLSFFSTAAAMAFFLAVPLLFIFPTPLVQFHDRLVAAAPSQDVELEEETS